MLQHVFLLVLTISILTITIGTVHAHQNISEQIYKMFSDLTPDNLGFKNLSFEHPGGFAISPMPGINTSNNLITNIHKTGKE